MKKIKNKDYDSLSDLYIILIIYFFIIFIKSLKEILEIFTYGILKKELLTKDSNIGFDMKIKMK
tara:strand:- start:340 stop:531 length:192 start_codon:yes stop_codon:yes gene_type:complete